MEKKIENYLHYYLKDGQSLMVVDGRGQLLTVQGIDHTFVNPIRCAVGDSLSAKTYGVLRPILRKLSSMTVVEKDKWDSLRQKRTDGVHRVYLLTETPESFHYLLSKHFWLFGDDWFDEGLIIDKETIKS